MLLLLFWFVFAGVLFSSSAADTKLQCDREVMLLFLNRHRVRKRGRFGPGRLHHNPTVES